MIFLRQPYPYFHKGRELLRNGLLILLLSFLFEYLFEPFNVNREEHLFDYWIIVLVHAGQSAVTYLVLFTIIGFFTTGDNWKIHKEVLALLLTMFLIGSNGFFLRDLIYDNPNNSSIDYYFEEVRNTMLVGSIIIFLILTINFNLLNLKNRKQAGGMHLANLPTSNDIEKISIKANVSSDHFDLLLSDLLCIKSDGNYLELFMMKENGGSEKLIKRLTLQGIQTQLEKHPIIVKTHRAFLVNINHLQKVTGNAQGYQLDIKNLHFKVPVSRGHLKSFNELVG